MLVKVLSILSVVSICVDGISPELEPKHAVSTQSFHRDDVPLSYTYTAVHIYTTPSPENHPSYLRTNHQEPLKYHTVQYAPLVQSTRDDNKRYKHILETDEKILNSEENRKGHLEPREEENLEEHNQKYRSFVPGHNIEVLQSNRVNSQNELYRVYHDDLENQKVNFPKLVSNNNPQLHIQSIPETFRTVEQRPLSEEHNILYSFLPKPNVNNQRNGYAIEKSHNIPQALPAKIPRLHLNIARVYGIAHLPQQALINKPIQRPIGNPPTYTEAIFFPLRAPKKTFLYPVQDPKKNYPVHT